MARRTGRAALQLSESDREMLTTLSRSATATAREVTRAKVLLKYEAGVSITQIQREVGVSRPTIYKCVDKALAAGVRTGLRDRYHRPREPEILPDAKAWVVSVACQQPKALGLAAELWTLSALTAHVQCEAEAAGFPRLSRISRSSVWRILQEQRLAHPAGAGSEAASGALLSGTSRPGVRPQDAGSPDGLSRRVPDAAVRRCHADHLHGVRGREAGRTGYRHHCPGSPAGGGATGDAVARP